MPLISVGKVISLVSEAADGAALPSKFVGLGASDGTLLQALIVEDATNPNLRMVLYGGLNKVGVTTIATDALSAATIALQVKSALFEFNGTTWDRIRSYFRQQATTINSNGAGTTIDISTTPMSKFTIQVFRTTGSSECIVDVEGSIDNTNWLPLGTLTFDATSGMLHIADKPVMYLRYNVTTIGASNVVTVTLIASAR